MKLKKNNQLTVKSNTLFMQRPGELQISSSSCIHYVCTMAILLSEYGKFSNDELTHRNIKTTLFFCVLKNGNYSE